MEWAEIYQALARERGDPEAWEALVRHVQAWAQRSLGGRGQHVVDDTVADTCSRVVLDFERARGPETFAGFVYGHFMNVRTRALQGPVVFPLEGVDLPDESADDPDADVVEQLEAWLRALPERERRALELRYFERASAQRIAAELALTPGNARRVVFNGLARLRRLAQAGRAGGRGQETSVARVESREA